MADHNWQPIQPLSENDRKVDLAAMQPLYEAWRASKERLAKSSSESLKEFNKRLVRRLSIETGILERIYDIDRGTTEALVAHGFAENLVGRSSTNIEPSRLIDILKDHESAIQLVMDCVAGNRKISKSVMHELHSILTRHQDTTTAVDQFGTKCEIPLLHGKFKEHPNNPKRQDGRLHEYCPPIHVDSEIEHLIGEFENYTRDDPVIVAAWLHHRFTQIHPYQDGNGRVVRALTSLVLLQAGLLPLLIDRDLRIEYIQALESADDGDLSVLSQLFARLERAGVMQALSVDADQEISYQKSLTSAVIGNLANKLGRRKQEKDAELRKVNFLALKLRGRTRNALEQAFRELEAPVSDIAEPQINMADGGPDRNNSHWYRSDIISIAHSAGKFVNLQEDHYFVKASMRVGSERLVFVSSFHHVGRELSGIMEGTSFARLESFEDPDDWDRLARDSFPCSVEPFVFTYKTDENEIGEAFDRWLDAAVAVAFKEFGDRL